MQKPTSEQIENKFRYVEVDNHVTESKSVRVSLEKTFLKEKQKEKEKVVRK